MDVDGGGGIDVDGVVDAAEITAVGVVIMQTWQQTLYT